MPLVARFDAPVEHTQKELGNLIGLGAGLVAGLVIGALIVGTGGLALVVIAVGAAAGGAAVGEKFVQAEKPSNVQTGIIGTGSPNVHITHRAAARAVADETTCEGTPPLYLPSHMGKRIAQGAATVTVNSRFLARVGDKIECGAVIGADPPNTLFVLVGGPTATALRIDDELPGWLRGLEAGAAVVGLVGGLLVFGLEAMAIGMLVASAGGEVGKDITAALGGDKDWQEFGSSLGEFVGGFIGFGEGAGEGEGGLGGIGEGEGGLGEGGLGEGAGEGEGGLGEGEGAEPGGEEGAGEQGEGEQGEGEQGEGEQGEGEQGEGEQGEGEQGEGEQGEGKPGDADEPPGEERTCKSDPVDVATGAVTDEQVDVSLPGAFPFVWKRTYSSRRARGRTSLGHGGWSHGFEQWIALDGDALTLRSDDGREIYFARVQPGESTFHRRERLTLTAGAGGSFTVHSLDTRLTRELAPLRPGGPAVLRAIRDAHGNAITVEYAGEGIRRIIDTAGREIQVALDGEGRVTRLEVRVDGALELWFDYAYTARGELAIAADALGNAERYAYDAARRLVRKTLKNGVAFHYAYDEDTGWCVRAWGDGGVLPIELTPDRAARTTSMRGNEAPRLYRWNEAGLVVEEATPEGAVIETRAYDRDLYLIAKGNGAGETTRYAYDARGNKIREVDPAGNETTWEYEDDRLVKRTAPGGLVTTYRRDPRGDLVEIVYPGDHRYAIDRDRRGRVSAFHGPGGRLKAMGYDARHDLVWEENARGARTRYACDALGRPISRTDALERTTRVRYDRLRRPVAVGLPDGTGTETEYDAVGNVTRFADALGQVTRMEYAGTGVLARVTQADGSAWRFDYDGDQRLQRILNPRAEGYEIRYDQAGRIQSEKTFDGRLVSYDRDEAGRVSRIEHPDETWRELSYDALGNVVGDRTPDGDVSFARDPLGRVLTAVLTERSGKVVTEIERDALGRVVAEKQNGRAVRYAYDEIGLLASRTLPGGRRTRYHYDLTGALAGVDHGGHEVRLERDALGRETRRRVRQGSVDIERRYDALDRLIEQRVAAPASAGGEAAAILAERRWSYDGLGRVQQIDDRRWGSTRYAYDALGQLLEAARGGLHEVFDYDPAGSLRRIVDALSQVGDAPAWEMAPGNVLTGTPGVAYENDARGRRVKKTVRAGGSGGEARAEITGYRWDCRDRLREVALPDGRRARYTYDAFGRRVRKEIVAAPGKGGRPASAVVELLWDGDVLAGELDPARGDRFFVHEPGTFVPLLQEEQGAVFTYVNDHLGTPKELLDQDGRVAWAAAHSAWGRVVEVQRDPGARRAVESPFRLLGQYHDEETGLCATRFRYFDPALGRWCSPDPLGIDGGSNLFAFGASPSTHVDPLGLAPDVYRGIPPGMTGHEVRPNDFRSPNPETGRQGRGISTFSDPSAIPPNRGTPHLVNPDSLPDGLAIEQRGGNPNHYEIVPTRPMTQEEYQDLVNQVEFEPPQPPPEEGGCC